MRRLDTGRAASAAAASSIAGELPRNLVDRVPKSGAARLVGVRVSIVEDHALLAQSLRFALRAEGADVLAVEPSSAEQVIGSCTDHRPQVVLLDLDLGHPVLDGLTLVAPLTSLGISVVVLTGTTDAARQGACVEAGAIGVLSKSQPLETVVDQVAGVARGQRILPAQRRMDLVLESRRRRALREQQLAPFESLTEREAEVLAALTHGHQVEEIARLLFITETTVRTHVRGILSKLGVRSQLAAVAHASEVGWVAPQAGPADSPRTTAS